ncbi:hypothetical protein [Vibrio sp. T11.5]|nr:hypothetical protein [Vibrio sp. T11.5]MDA0120024.1 hypothetical protein [Vibrio sp. T11.5]
MKFRAAYNARQGTPNVSQCLSRDVYVCGMLLVDIFNEGIR